MGKFLFTIGRDYHIMIILYPILFLILKYRYSKNQIKLPLTTLILNVYILSSSSAVFLYYFEITGKYDGVEISFHSVIFLFACLFLFIEGFRQIEKRINLRIPHIHYKYISLVVIIIIIFSFLAILDSVLLLKSIMGMSVEEVRFGYNQGNLFQNRTGAIIEYIKSISIIIFPVTIFLLFYVYHFYEDKRMVILSLLVSSLSIVFANLTIAGRDGVVRWIFMFFSVYILFSEILDRKKKKTALIFGSIIVALSVAVILFVTIQRFGSTEVIVIANSLIDYFSQGFINFSTYFDLFKEGTFFGRRTFPVFFSSDETISGANMNKTLGLYSFQLNVFSTMIGSFYMEFGYLRTIIVSILFYYLFMLIKALYTNENILFLLPMLLFLYDLIFGGIFFFVYFSPMFQKMFFAYLLFLIIRRLNKKSIKLYS